MALGARNDVAPGDAAGPRAGINAPDGPTVIVEIRVWLDASVRDPPLVVRVSALTAMAPAAEPRTPINERAVIM